MDLPATPEQPETQASATTGDSQAGDSQSVNALVSAGFSQIGKAQTLLGQLRTHLLQAGVDGKDLPANLGSWFRGCANPDQALLNFVTLAERDTRRFLRVVSNERERGRVLVLFGASNALANYVLNHLQLLDLTLPPLPPPRPLAGHASMGSQRWSQGASEPTDMIAWLSSVLDENVDTIEEIRRAYWSAMILIAFEDVTASDRQAHMPHLSAHITDLVEATLELAYQRARKQVRGANGVEISVLVLGKTGGQELNYISDVDVIYIYRPRDPALSERQCAQIATQVATQIALVCSGPGSEPPLWSLDAGLRPEGRDGALVRSLESCREYYETWAKNWEFHALMKARHGAGSRALSDDFLTMVEPLVWSVAGREGFVDDVRQMRQLVEGHIPAVRQGREIKLGPGGLRDIEFSVQLLQLVHGHADESLRVRNTLEAIGRLSQGGYIARSDACELDAAYRFLRTIEHRAQVSRMRRTHMMPTAAEDLRSIGRGIDMQRYSRVADLEDEWQRVRSRVRSLQQSLFYRPLVEATAQLSRAEMLMQEDAVRDRLEAFGYKDTTAALRHIHSLTQGSTRTAMIHRHLLPVMLGWLADGANPDQGLLNFRTLSEQIGSTHWYMALLRDSAAAAQALSEILATSTFTVKALEDQPEAIQWLDNPRDLEPKTRARLKTECCALLDRHDFAATAMERIRYVRYREVTRAAMADVTLGVDPIRAASILTPATDVAIDAALTIARAQLEPKDSGMAITAVALGRYGGGELTYGSDADVMFVHDSGDLPALEGQAIAEKIVKEAIRLLSQIGASPAIAVDTTLRPEGKNGPLTRTLSSYEEYFTKWASPWQRQAMIRSRVIGDTKLDKDVQSLIERFVWGQGLNSDEVKQIKLLKARMENERLPRGLKPTYHFKLGPGGLSDVEWVVQLYQLRHGHEVEILRTPMTLQALDGLEQAGLVAPTDASVLRHAWLSATQHRAANVLATERTTKMDELAHDPSTARPVARLLRYDAGSSQQMVEDYLRQARQARQVFSQYFR